MTRFYGYLGSVLGALALAIGLPLAASAQTVDSAVASSTAAIADAGGTISAVFFGVLPTILMYVIPIVLVLWGVRWLIRYFSGGKR